MHRFVALTLFHQFEATNDFDDLLGRIFLLKEASHDRKVACRVMSSASGSSSPGNSSAMGAGILIAVVDVVVSVSNKFLSDGAALPSYLGGNR